MSPTLCLGLLDLVEFLAQIERLTVDRSVQLSYSQVMLDLFVHVHDVLCGGVAEECQPRCNQTAPWATLTDLFDHDISILLCVHGFMHIANDSHERANLQA